MRKYAGNTGTYEKHYYMGTNPLLQTTQSGGNVIGENILDASGKVIASRRENAQGGGSKYWLYHYDLQGKMVSMAGVDAQGNLTYGEYNEYDPYGKPEAGSTTNVKNDVKYMGGVSDASGLYYLNARHYDANTGRFLQQDTYKGNPYAPWTQNLYAYCNNNPTSFIDPTGHAGWGSFSYEDQRMYHESKGTLKKTNDMISDSEKINGKKYVGKQKEDLFLTVQTQLIEYNKIKMSSEKGEIKDSNEMAYKLAPVMHALRKSLDYEPAATSVNYKGTEQLGDIYWTRYDPEQPGVNYKVYRDQVINSVLAFGEKARGGVFSFYHGHPIGHDAPNGNDNRAYSWDDMNEAEWLYRQMYPTINGMYYAYGDDRRLGNEGVAGFHVSAAAGWLQDHPFKTPNY